MKVSALIQLFKGFGPDVTVVVGDKADFLRAGLIRPLNFKDLQPLPLSEVIEDDEIWVCPWPERPADIEPIAPMLGLRIGPA